MATTLRATVNSGATTVSRALTHEELDANFLLTQVGTGASTETVQAALRRLVHTAQYSTQGNYETARDALTGTFGMANLDITDITTLLGHTPGQSTRVLKIKNADNVHGHGDFFWSIHSGTIALDMNANVSWGYNTDQATASEPELVYTIESDFHSGGQRYMEAHLQGHWGDATSFRCWSWQLNRSSKFIDNYVAVDRFQLRDSTAVNQAFIFQLGASTGNFQVNTGSFIDKTENNVGFVRQLNAAGNGNVDLIYLNSANVVLVAPAAGGALVNNVLNVSTNGFDMTKSASGATVTAQLFNTSNTASSQVCVDLVLNGGTAGDAFHQARINGGQEWSWGLDNSDSDAFVISAAAALGSNNRLKISTAGVVTIPNLAGTGSRTVVADANGVLSAP